MTPPAYCPEHHDAPRGVATAVPLLRLLSTFAGGSMASEFGRSPEVGRRSIPKSKDGISLNQTTVSFLLLHFPTLPQNGHAQPSARQRSQREENCSDRLW